MMTIPELQCEPSETPPSVSISAPAISALIHGSLSTRGVRSANEDVAFTGEIHPGSDPIIFALVADGLGGYSGGATASALARDGFVEQIYTRISRRRKDDDLSDVAEDIREAFHATNDAVVRYAYEHPALAEMGTTLTACVLVGNDLYIGNVGDSRAFLHREHRLVRMTKDDSTVQELVDAGVVTEVEATLHPRANEITRALGTPGDTDGIVITTQALIPGDIVIVCTDGLWKLGDAILADFSALLNGLDFTQENLDLALALVVEQALHDGSDDNISIAVLWVEPCTPPAEFAPTH